MSDWLFDLGNSRFKFAPLQGVAAGSVQAWAHGAEAMNAAALEALPRGDTAWVASVAAPALTERVMEVLQTRFAQVRVAHTQAQCAGVQIAFGASMLVYYPAMKFWIAKKYYQPEIMDPNYTVEGFVEVDSAETA